MPLEASDGGELQVPSLQSLYARRFGVKLDANEWPRFVTAGQAFERLGQLLDWCASESGAFVVERRPHLVLRRRLEGGVAQKKREQQ